MTLTSQQEADTLLRAFWDEREQKRREQRTHELQHSTHVLRQLTKGQSNADAELSIRR